MSHHLGGHYDEEAELEQLYTNTDDALKLFQELLETPRLQ